MDDNINLKLSQGQAEFLLTVLEGVRTPEGGQHGWAVGLHLQLQMAINEHAVTRNNALSNTCDHCGATFTRVTAQQRFCSTKCRVYFHRRQVA